uniref:Retrotransposon Copia-like N-terminal domain-containing protein n=1 Tax=Fagus sylvatica TaxID=28930 RepID=A0A2N9IA27_FAGSY
MSSGSSTKPSTVRTMVSNAKFEVEKFDGTNNFGMWQCEVMDVLVQQELDIALEDKPEEMSTKDWEKINRQACGTIRLCLAKDQKYFVMRETKAKELWKKLENKYMTKSMENRLYLKKNLFCFQFREDRWWHHMKLVSKKEIACTTKRFGKDISNLINSGNIASRDIIVHDFFTDKVVVYFNVFGSSMEDGIRSKCQSANIVTLEC